MPTILTYNINGIRAALKKDLNDWLALVNPDVVCLQEIKAKPEQLDQQAFNKIGYKCYINSAEKPGYSGVAILSKIKPKHIVMYIILHFIDDPQILCLKCLFIKPLIAYICTAR